MAIRVSACDLAFGQLIAGELLEDEPIEGLVGIEGADHVIAIPPGERLGGVALVAVGLGVPDQVEPVPRPALAVGRAGEQVVDQPLDRVRGPREVFQKRCPFFGRRRQPGQVEEQPAHQRPAARPPARATTPVPRAWPARTDRSGCAPRSVFLTAGTRGGLIG